MMEVTGKLQGIVRDYITHKPVVSFVLEDDPQGVDKLTDKTLTITAKVQRKNRSLDSNAYFHVLCDRLRQALGMSMIRMKHILISDYGQILYIGDVQQILHSTLPVEYVMEHEYMMGNESYHLPPIGTDSEGLNVYRIYRGSHTYNSQEMAYLIDHTISECKAQGIETATPEQLQRMAALWEEKRHEQS